MAVWLPHLLTDFSTQNRVRGITRHLGKIWFIYVNETCCQVTNLRLQICAQMIFDECHRTVLGDTTHDPGKACDHCVRHFRQCDHKNSRVWSGVGHSQ